MSNRFILEPRVFLTPNALKACTQAKVDAASLVTRHRAGDWGTADAAANEAGLDGSDVLISIFDVGGVSVWVYTEEDRSATTVLLPSER